MLWNAGNHLPTDTGSSKQKKEGGPSSVKSREKWGRLCSLTAESALGSLCSAVSSFLCLLQGCQQCGDQLQQMHIKCEESVIITTDAFWVSEDSKLESCSWLIACLCILLNEVEKLHSNTSSQPGTYLSLFEDTCSLCLVNRPPLALVKLLHLYCCCKWQVPIIPFDDLESISGCMLCSIRLQFWYFRQISKHIIAALNVFYNRNPDFSSKLHVNFWD